MINVKSKKDQRFIAKKLVLGISSVGLILAITDSTCLAITLQQQINEIKNFTASDVAKAIMTIGTVVGGGYSIFKRSLPMFLSTLAIVGGMAYSLDWIGSDTFGTSKSIMSH